MSIISLQHVGFVYNEGSEDALVALHDINLEINEGEFAVVLGHNGSGKSTLAFLLNGLNVPSSGVVTIDGMDTRDDKNFYKITSTVGVVFQNPDNQMVASIIEDDIAFGPENLGLPREEIKERIDWALECVEMSEFRKSMPFRLSGGQKQRVAIAGVLALKPKVLVLDEATSMLDPQGRESVMALLHKLNKELGITVICITHYMEEAIGADKIIVIDRGTIGYVGDKSLFSDTEKVRSFDLELPPAAAVASELKNYGIELDGVYTADDLVEALCQ